MPGDVPVSGTDVVASVPRRLVGTSPETLAAQQHRTALEENAQIFDRYRAAAWLEVCSGMRRGMLGGVCSLFEPAAQPLCQAMASQCLHPDPLRQSMFQVWLRGAQGIFAPRQYVFGDMDECVMNAAAASAAMVRIPGERIVLPPSELVPGIQEKMDSPAIVVEQVAFSKSSVELMSGDGAQSIDLQVRHFDETRSIRLLLRYEVFPPVEGRRLLDRHGAQGWLEPAGAPRPADAEGSTPGTRARHPRGVIDRSVDATA